MLRASQPRPSVTTPPKQLGVVAFDHNNPAALGPIPHAKNRCCSTRTPVPRPATTRPPLQMPLQRSTLAPEPLPNKSHFPIALPHV